MPPSHAHENPDDQAPLDPMQEVMVLAVGDDVELRSIADELKLRCVDGSEVSAVAMDAAPVVMDQATLVLLRREDGALAIADPSELSRPIACDLLADDVTSGAGRTLRQPLARALGLHRKPARDTRFIDATAGWGRDAWRAAAFECRVLAIERQPIVALLLRDALRRARESKPDIAGRITLIAGNAVTVLQQISQQIGSGGEVYAAGDALIDSEPLESAEPFRGADAVLLDPMFPLGRHAAERKPLRILRRLSGDDSDAASLFAAAQAAGIHRVVVKRPSKAPPLSPNPQVVQKGKAVRYDVYFP